MSRNCLNVISVVFVKLIKWLSENIRLEGIELRDDGYEIIFHTLKETESGFQLNKS